MAPPAPGAHQEVMLLLADCVLAIDGIQVALSRAQPAPNAATGARQLCFGVSSMDAPRLTKLIGRTGVVHTRSGVVLMRLQLQRVDPELNVISGQLVAP